MLFLQQTEVSMHFSSVLELKSPLFSGISDKDFVKLLTCLEARRKHFQKNEIIFSAGDPIPDTGVLLNGFAQINYEDVFGNRSILGEIGPGELFGEAFSFTNADKLPVSVAARTESDVLLINSRRILHSCPSSCEFHQRLIENMVRILAMKNVSLNKKIRYLSMRSTREKLLAYLSDQASTAESRIFEIPFNRQELADFLCVDRSAMSSELGKLKKEGLLDFHRSKFKLLTARETSNS